MEGIPYTFSLFLFTILHSLGVREVLRLGGTKAFQSIGASPQDPLEAYTPQCDGFAKNSDDYWICRLKHYTFTVYHPTSTCRMGAKDDPTAVVDPELRLELFS
jgi:choline dehydrogenase